jgi:hypothetical protein
MPQPRNASNVRRGREGSRWYNQRPTAREFADWFQTVPIDDGLKHQDYVSGVVLIPSKEKGKEVREFNQTTGAPIIADVENLVYSPHPNVTTRIRYFKDYLALHPEWVGVYEVDRAKQDVGLPDGFFRYSAAGPDGKPVNFVGYSVRARVLLRDTVRHVDVREGTIGGVMVQTRRVEGTPVLEGTPGSKIAPVAGRWGVDENALMKAQSGAVGRALGNLGMLVIPGAGIATSEDMHEALSGENVGVPTPELPPATPVQSRDDNAERIKALKSDLQQLSPVAVQEFETWAMERGLKMDNAGDVNTAIRRLERDIDRLSRAEAA